MKKKKKKRKEEKKRKERKKAYKLFLHHCNVEFSVIRFICHLNCPIDRSVPGPGKIFPQEDFTTVTEAQDFTRCVHYFVINTNCTR